MQKKNWNLEKFIYYSLLAFAFTIPLSVLSITFFMFIFLILVFINGNFISNFKEIKNNKIYFYLGLFLLYIFISSLWAEDNERMINNLGKYFYWIIIPSIYILAKKEWILNILNSFLMGMFVSEILSYLIYFGFIDFLNGTQSSPSPFMNSINYSVFLAFTSLILLYRFLFEDNSNRTKVFMFLFFLLTTTNLLISIGRTGQLAFFVTLFIVFIIKYRVSIKAFTLTTIIIFSIFLAGYQGIDLFKIRVDSAISDINKVIVDKNFESSWGIRVGYWIVSYDSFKESPILGQGLGDYRITAKKYTFEENRYPYFSQYVKDFITKHRFHNQYLMFVIEGGLIGLLLFLLLIYKLYSLKIENTEIKHISIIGLTIFLVGFFGDTLLYIKFPQGLFLLIVAITILSTKNDIKITTRG